jgi:hypothetical protein
MKRFLCILVVITFVTGGCDVRNKNKKSIETIAVSDSLKATSVMMIDSVYDFGKIAEGESVEFSYRFRNAGDMPLIVTNVSASCGCTVPERPEAPVQPGETGYIKVKFNSDRRPGETHKTVMVKSNATPEFPQLLLKGTVLPKTNKQ